MKVYRLLIAAIAGTICFAVVAAAMLHSLCAFGYGRCSGGSAFQPWFLTWFWVSATLILVVTLALHHVVHRLRFYRPWLMLLLYPVVAVCVPKLWALLTGSGFVAIRSWSMLDAVFGASGFVMGLILFIIWHQRPNNSFKPKPLRGSA